MIVPLLACWVGALGISQYQWPTLSQELAKHGVPVPTEIADAARQITSYAVLNDEDWFGIGYYWYDGSDRLPETVHLRTYEKRKNQWRHQPLQLELGSVTHIRRAAARRAASW